MTALSLNDSVSSGDNTLDIYMSVCLSGCMCVARSLEASRLSAQTLSYLQNTHDAIVRSSLLYNFHAQPLQTSSTMLRLCGGRVFYQVILPNLNQFTWKISTVPSQCLAQHSSGGCQRSTAIYAVEIWDHQGSRSVATVHSDYATTTTMMKDDLCQKGREN